MGKSIQFDVSKAAGFLTDVNISELEKRTLKANDILINKTGAGNDFLGWIDQPVNYDRDEFKRIKAAAAKIRQDSDALVVIGIGGSYLGARAVIESLSHTFYNSAEARGGKRPEIYFAGNNISSSYLSDVVDVVKDKDFSVNIISKSGTTTEPALAFRVFRELLVEKYGAEAAGKRIYATTDRQKGALKNLADKEGYETFVVPDDIGGRYSVFSAVGLLPIAVAGLDIDALMQGAADERKHILSAPFAQNEAFQYAAYRNVMLDQGKTLEILENYEPNFHYISEWWKQLYGESEGKDRKGIFPASVDLTTDLHSMGQFIQDGTRMMFETVVWIEKPRKSLTVGSWDGDPDGINYLAGKTFDYVNKYAMSGTLLAHIDGDSPNFMITIPELNEYYLGSLLYFFMYACGVSGYILDVNPFNQPGVEDYKRNMFALLGKPGYEEEGEKLRKRL